jgi:Clp amino terminal domain, pathogenicity island component
MSTMLGTAGQQVFGREPGQALSAIRRLRKELELVEEAQVANALAQGWSWARIGRALGISRQAAHHKYSHCVPAPLSTAGPVLAPNVRVALLLARTEAASRGDMLVGTEHLLTGLFQQGESDAARALRAAGVHLRTLRAALDVLAPSDVCSIAAAQMSLTARGTRAFERAALQAHGESSRRITDVHLLTAILETPSSGAEAVLRAIGVDTHSVGRALAQGESDAPAMLSR